MGYRPRAIRAGLSYDLPLPLMQCGESFTKRVATSEIPLQPGVLVGSISRGAATITQSGIIVKGNPQDSARTGHVSGEVTSIEAEKESMIEFFNDSDEPFDFYRYIAGALIGISEYGDTSATRFYQQCVLQSLTFDNSNRTVHHLPYTLTFLVPDGTLWWT